MSRMKRALLGSPVRGTGGWTEGARGSVQEWLPIKNIVRGMVFTKDDRFIRICELLPVNFYLKSPTDQQNIILSFAAYLKIAPDNLQILVRTQTADMSGYLSRMRDFAETEEDPRCREMIEDNIAEVGWLGGNGVISRRFFLAFSYEPQMKARRNTVSAIAQRLAEEVDTARRYLELCGLEVLEPQYADNMQLELLYELLNKKTSQRVKLPEGVFDMTTAIHGIYETEEQA
mgnify:FL=1